MPVARSRFAVRRATEADADFIVAVHDLPHARDFVAVPTREVVLASLFQPDRATFVVTEDGAAVGMLLLAYEPDAPWLVEARRLVVAEPDRGVGSFAADWLIAHAFGELRAHRVWLDVVDLCVYAMLATDAPPGARTQRVHTYRTRVEWTGNRGTGTSSYRAYERSHTIGAGTKPAIAGSSDPAFRGDAARWSPEELLVGSLSACHQLSYLHLCADAGIAVVAYEDEAEGVLVEESDGGGRFVAVVLRPRVTIASESHRERARALHEEAARRCFIARSVRFPVTHEPVTVLR